ncbi:hypothetical protein FOA52_010774 [Chlamydomonas sp. UWO 241]|nr:hypothetical protein FOA52_010774 [Chlamydomonas sp. UWO 241]
MPIGAGVRSCCCLPMGQMAVPKPVVPKKPRIAGWTSHRGAGPLRASGETETLHRTERLTNLAKEFVHHWAEGAKEGPTDAVMGRLGQLMDDGMLVHAAGSPLGKGTVGVRDRLVHTHDMGGALQPKSVVLSAATEDDDSVFCLIECEEVPGAEGGIPSDEVHRAYGIVKFDVLFDDTALRVTEMFERYQLGPNDAPLLAVHAGAHKDMRAALKEAGMSRFPSANIVKSGDFDREAAKLAISAWCTARTTGFDETKLLAGCLDADKYRLWDGYGILPLVCGIDKAEGTTPASCIQDYKGIVDMIFAAKAKYHIECKLVDSAVCTDCNVGFSHWRSHIRPFERPGGNFVMEVDVPLPPPFLIQGREATIDAMEIHIFNKSGKITDTWMLRDPMPEERQMMVEAKTKEEAASA